jgi:inorganic pyrophosphatase
MTTPYLELEPFEPETHELNVVVETPKGSRNKFEFDEKHGIFKLSGVLPAGANFPFDFGFVPSTLGQDGDPLDVLVLMDEPAFTGCLVPSRLIGVITAEQTERAREGEAKGETMRNDRLIAVAADSRTHQGLETIVQLGETISGNILLSEIEHFFISYNTIKGKQFNPLGRFGPDHAERLIKEGIKRFQTK